MTGEELAAIRRSAGLTQVQLAALAGLERRAIGYWEAKPVLSLRSGAVRRIMDVLGMSDYWASYRARTGWGLTLQREHEQLMAQIAKLQAALDARALRRRVRCDDTQRPAL